MTQKTETISRTATLAEQVAQRIAQGIFKAHFAEGERLVEAKLAERYGVSRGPVREALQLLSHQGMVEIREGKGAYVRSVTAEELEKMIVLRGTLEGLAARIVAASGNEEQLDKLERISKEMRDAQTQGDVSTFRKLRARFHETLCEFAGYPMTSSWWQSMHNLARIFHGQWALDASDTENPQEQVDVSVLRERNPDVAERHVRAFILREGYKRLGREIPAALKDYVE
ncbi:MAG TPA: GntR family transcriptional regulator [Burkholderiales bacterium]|jgi:DNA-binding GntR family transcriptional regulator|nr:GntR family transcriptional regulator [Burkholderiales bacterium]